MLLRLTGKALVGAGPDKVIVHVAYPGLVIDEGVQELPLRLVEATTASEKDLLTPLAEPVIIAVSLVDTAPTVAVNVALDEPAGTETLDGTVTLP